MTLSRQSVTILSPFFHPEQISTGKYNAQLAQALALAQVDVNVICSHPLYPDWVPIPAKGSDELPGIKTHRGGGWLHYPAHPLLRRVVLELWFTFHCCTQLLLNKRQIGSVVVPVFPPSLFMMLAPALIPASSRTVGIIHDLQGVYAARSNGILSRALRKIISAVEGRAFRACDHLIFLSKTMRDVTVEEYGIDASRTSVHYPFTSIVGAVSEEDRIEVERYFSPGQKAVVYSGALGEKQAPKQLVDLMLSILQNNPDWQARVFSQGPVFDQLQRTYSHPRLEFLPLVDAALLPALLARSDVQIVPQAQGTSEGSLPSKLPNILASGARLLCITDPGSELADLLSHQPGAAVSTTWEIKDCLVAFDSIASSPRVTGQQASDLLKAFSLQGLTERILAEAWPSKVGDSTP